MIKGLIIYLCAIPFLIYAVSIDINNLKDIILMLLSGGIGLVLVLFICNEELNKSLRAFK
jgi:hypothetical protein